MGQLLNRKSYSQPYLITAITRLQILGEEKAWLTTKKRQAPRNMIGEEPTSSLGEVEPLETTDLDSISGSKTDSDSTNGSETDYNHETMAQKGLEG
jgi:hypothetical protein